MRLHLSVVVQRGSGSPAGLQAPVCKDESHVAYLRHPAAPVDVPLLGRLREPFGGTADALESLTSATVLEVVVGVKEAGMPLIHPVEL
jgi:hypothetical protein